jgi:hypothetical protein
MSPLAILAQVITTNNLPHPGNVSIQPILNIVFGIAGSVSLLMVVIGGFRYIISNGDPSGTSQAKDTIIYAIVGLVIVILAYSIVNLVILKVTR